MRSRWPCAVLVAMVLTASAVAAQTMRVGERAPEIDLPALGGGRVLLSLLRGHPVVVSFWATWCPPCRDEFPELVRAHRTHGPAGLYVIGVNGRDQELRTKDVQEFVDEFAVPFPIALDQRGSARRTYGLIGLPTTVFIDSGGVVRNVHMGPINREELNRKLASIVASR